MTGWSKWKPVIRYSIQRIIYHLSKKKKSFYLFQEKLAAFIILQTKMRAKTMGNKIE